MSWFDSILSPIMWVVAWIMTGTHSLFSMVLDPDGGLVWVLSIVMLVVVMRVLMIPLFVRQIRSSRGMQLIQPEMQKIQKKYKGKTDPISRQRQQAEMMALYRKNGTNPMSSCLPILVQSPFFFALFRVLNNLVKISNGTVDPIGPIDQALARSAETSTLFGAPLSSTFMLADAAPDGASPLTVRIVTVVLIALMSLTTFTTQRQLTMKNMPDSAKDNPMFRTQKMMLYVFPLIFAFSGVNFPIGVLIYWFTTNVWSMGQQFIVIRRMPAPGSEAEARMKERKQRSRKAGGGQDAEADGASGDDAGGAAGAAGAAGAGGAGGAADAGGARAGGQRTQPKRQPRSKRRGPLPQAANPSPAEPAPAAGTAAGGPAETGGGKAPGHGEAGHGEAGRGAAGGGGAATAATGAGGKEKANRAPSGSGRGGKKRKKG
ncbi:MAG: membrane protein insertase YidC [Bifidobacteriaceae bacterium]|nr:membrane protein insertase YidC [Bifidobacteriaceae bacterium]